LMSSRKSVGVLFEIVFGLYIRKTGRNTGENVTGIIRDNRKVVGAYVAGPKGGTVHRR
ncbi:hypothetical protein T02_12023, partial [Trichinella nativa]